MSIVNYIRLATLDDAESILGIYKPYIENSSITFEYVVPSVEEYKERMKNIMEKYPWLVYEKDGKVIGFAYATKFRERAAYQWDFETSVYVNEKFHRSGIASSLYHALLDRCTEMGFHNAIAGLTLPNEKSFHFHKKLGFTLVGVFKNVGFKHGAWHDVMFMEKNLKPCIVEPGEIAKP